jgi:hypothetical protein
MPSELFDPSQDMQIQQLTVEAPKKDGPVFDVYAELTKEQWAVKTNQVREVWEDYARAGGLDQAVANGYLNAGMFTFCQLRPQENVTATTERFDYITSKLNETFQIRTDIKIKNKLTLIAGMKLAYPPSVDRWQLEDNFSKELTEEFKSRADKLNRSTVAMTDEDEVVRIGALATLFSPELGDQLRQLLTGAAKKRMSFLNEWAVTKLTEDTAGEELSLLLLLCYSKIFMPELWNNSLLTPRIWRTLIDLFESTKASNMEWHAIMLASRLNVLAAKNIRIDKYNVELDMGSQASGSFDQAPPLPMQPKY